MAFEITHVVLTTIFILAFLMGIIVNKSNFCTMGAVSDWVNIGDTGRFRAWLFAIAVALLGVTLSEYFGVFTLDNMRPPYRTENFMWPRYILGGLLFGIGMTLASGCGNKVLVRIGGGNIKSVVVFFVVGVFAYLMTKTDFYGIVFHGWMQTLSINLKDFDIEAQDIPSLLAAVMGGVDVELLRLIIGLMLGIGLIIYAFKSVDFRSKFDNVFSGAMVGALVLGAWYVTAGPLGVAWLEYVEWLDERPAGVAQQSFTFVNPMGETLAFLVQPTHFLLVTFGVIAVAGVILGSLAYAIVSRSFRLEWFASLQDFVMHIIGAILMGIGGVLAMGCTIGQGITGIATLALGSFMAFFSIVLGSALTMKVQYYKMVYEEDATFIKSLVTSLVDMRLLPASMRKLDAV